uniref:Uncharacterized protein n=1 Tax=viral metagenome TaxID=1070528 RepID=A0A6C0DFI8_9ZZZZ
MNIKLTFVATALLLLLVASILMSASYKKYVSMCEGFQPSIPVSFPPNMGSRPPAGTPIKEGFNSYFLENAGGAKADYKPMGAYDGVQLPTGNTISKWRYTAPNEKLLGDEFVPGPDSLFMFKNNQCKPECCGSSFSCGGGCVCTTPEQRQYVASRGGNSTKPEDLP